MYFLQNLVVALILTILIEYIVYLIFISKEPMKLFLYSVLINSFTNPLFNYLLDFRFHELYYLEILVAIVESILIMLLMEISYPKALFVSITANLASLLIGLAIFA
jgi:hypothetical protein